MRLSSNVNLKEKWTSSVQVLHRFDGVCSAGKEQTLPPVVLVHSP